MLKEKLDNQIKVQKEILIKHYPVSTYRLQFNRNFTFRDAARLVPYLHELGVTDIYASPYFKARPGTTHGYDITSYNLLNPEIGSEEDYNLFTSELQKYHMGQLLDFVPNHMSVFHNRLFDDVLKHGVGSPYATFFDIEWYPVKPELQNKLLLPVLEDQYSKVLERGDLQLAYNEGEFEIIYQGNAYRIDPISTPPVLEDSLKKLKSPDGELRQLKEIVANARRLPNRDRADGGQMIVRQQMEEEIKVRMARLYESNYRVKKLIDTTVREFNSPGFNRLHKLLEMQPYRFSFWRNARKELNYRRFFEVNSLIGVRMERPEVFALAHGLLLKLLGENKVSGIRIDHIDGLLDPAAYLSRLQQAYFLELCQRASVAAECPDPDESRKVIRPLFVVVEKILAENEKLPPEWFVDGTTGYEFAVLINRLFVDSKNEQDFVQIYRRFNGVQDDFKDEVYRCKKLLMQTSLANEINLLTHMLDSIGKKSKCCNDFTLNDIKEAVIEFIACLPVYRTYINALNDSIPPGDEAIIKSTINEAKKRNPSMGPAIFDFLQDVLLLRQPADSPQEARKKRQRFVMRFQQTTGAVMAKGFEDTALYRYDALVSLNEVGGNPTGFGIGIDEFHRRNIERWKTMPHSLLATSTHDSKRSEDVRARIDVLSEMPEEWRSALNTWSRINQGKKTILSGFPAPDRNEEYLIYQTLLGTYPDSEMDEIAQAEYLKRMQEYLRKALREAKQHTNWADPNEKYESAVAGFLSALLDSGNRAFLADFKKINAIVAHCGRLNSLSQVVLKCFSPGTPDIYRGNELWDLSLVDPDNRRPVDFDQRIKRLNQIKQRAREDLSGLIIDLVNNMDDGDIKLYVTWKSLAYRRENAGFFNTAAYQPLKAKGAKREHFCAFAWQDEQRELLVLAPRLVAGLTGSGRITPLGTSAWGHSWLPLSVTTGAKILYHNIFTDDVLRFGDSEHSGLRLAEVFQRFPVAVLESIT